MHLNSCVTNPVSADCEIIRPSHDGRRHSVRVSPHGDGVSYLHGAHDSRRHRKGTVYQRTVHIWHQSFGHGPLLLIRKKSLCSIYIQAHPVSSAIRKEKKKVLLNLLAFRSLHNEYNINILMYLTFCVTCGIESTFNL